VTKMATVVAVEAQGLHLPTGEVRTLRFATHGFATEPGDTPPDVFFQPAIGQNLPGLARTMFEETGVYGASQISVGTVELINHSGAFDALATDYAFDGRRVEVRVGRLGQAYATWSVALVGTLETPETDGTTIRLVLRDRLSDLETWERPTYAGTNSAGLGLEGNANDLKGQTKPRVYGAVQNIAPRAVNDARWIYQVSDQLARVDAVYDNGGAVTRGADYASLAEIQTTAPAPGTFRAFQGYYRMGTKATGTMTADVTTTQQTVTTLLRQIALDAGIAAGDISADVAGDDSVVGIYAPNDATPRDLMDQLATSVGAWYGFDRLGRLRMGRLSVPVGPPARVWQGYSVMDLTLRRMLPPAKRVAVRYAHNWTPQQQVVGSLDGTPRQAWLREAYRTEADIRSSAVITALLNAWPNAAELQVDTELRDQAPATALAARLVALHGVPRLEFALNLPLDDLGDVDLGSVVAVDTPRYGMAGRLFVVIGMDTGQDGRSASVVMWG